MVIRILLVTALTFAGGCHCGLDTSPLDDLRCDEGQPCPEGTSCRGRFCVADDAGSGAPDARPDAAGGLDAGRDASADAEPALDASPDSAPPCLAPQVDCAGTCTDVQLDPDNCGECGNVCGADLVCATGECDDRCPAPLDVCGRRCVNLASDRDHCGACETPCDGNCSLGMCCALNEEKCSGACFDTMVSPDHCGGCGVRCDDPIAPVCVDGGCDCPDGVDGWELCDLDRCSRPLMDHAECGDCGSSACSGGEVCNLGSCRDWCGPDMTNCDGACVDADSDPYHCGGCRQQCRAGLVCNERTCAVACDRELDTCDGSCVDTDNSELHCGGCGSSCRAGEFCFDGQCRDPEKG